MTKREPFRVVAADPPWPFRDKLPGKGRGAAKHYDLLPMADLATFKLPRIADDAVLFLWRMASMQHEAIDLCVAWGFRPYGEIVWVKETATGKPHFGMGRLTRSSHESVLIGVRGKPTRLSASVRDVFSAPVGRHSEKPDRFYELVEELVPGPYVELFARSRRRGWTTYGLEVR